VEIGFIAYLSLLIFHCLSKEALTAKHCLQAAETLAEQPL
jgi:hypothetical protein